MSRLICCDTETVSVAMELRHLRAFLAVAEELHFGRAAARLGMAQPPLSRQIQRFEQELGERLFERNRRAVRLTPAGAALLPRAQAILDECERAEQLVRDIAAGMLGVVRLGFVGSAALSILPELVREFRLAHPHIALQLFELTTARQLAALARREIDVGLVRAHAPSSDVLSVTLLTETLVVALPDGHALASLKAIPLARLRDESFVMFPRTAGSRLHEQIISLCRTAGFDPDVVQEASHMQTLVGLVAGGVGIGIVPATVSSIRIPGIAYRRLAASHSGVTLRLAWRFRDMSPAVRRFVDFARTLAPDSVRNQSATL